MISGDSPEERLVISTEQERCHSRLAGVRECGGSRILRIGISNFLRLHINIIEFITPNGAAYSFRYQVGYFEVKVVVRDSLYF